MVKSVDNAVSPQVAAKSVAQIRIKPIDGWGFYEAIDGKLAQGFEVGDIEFGVDLGGITGWRGKVISNQHKYAGMLLEMTPRHAEDSGVVVLKVLDGGRLVFSGMADSTGLTRQK